MELNTLPQDIFDSISFYLGAKDFSKCYETGDLCLHYLIRPKTIEAPLTEKSLFYRFLSLTTLALESKKEPNFETIEKYPPNLTNLTINGASTRWLCQVFPQGLKSLLLDPRPSLENGSEEPFDILWSHLPPKLTRLSLPCRAFDQRLAHLLPQSIEDLTIFILCPNAIEILLSGLRALPQSITKLIIRRNSYIPMRTSDEFELFKSLPKNIRETNLLDTPLISRRLTEKHIDLLPRFLLKFDCLDIKMSCLSNLPSTLETLKYCTTRDFCDDSTVILPESLTCINLEGPKKSVFETLAKSFLPNLQLLSIVNPVFMSVASLPSSLLTLDLICEFTFNHRLLLDDATNSNTWSRLKNLKTLSVIGFVISDDILQNLPISIRTFIYQDYVFHDRKIHAYKSLFLYAQLGNGAPFWRSLENLAIIGNCGSFIDRYVTHLSPTLKNLHLEDRTRMQNYFSLTNFGWDRLPSTLEHMNVTGPAEYFESDNCGPHPDWIPPKHLKRLVNITFKWQDFEFEFEAIWTRLTGRWIKNVETVLAEDDVD
jgi:hypothetical protein